MKMLGSLERSGLQIHLVFDEKVHSLMMVVGIVLPPWRGSLQMFLDQLNGSSSVFGYTSRSPNADDNYLV